VKKHERGEGGKKWIMYTLVPEMLWFGELTETQRFCVLLLVQGTLAFYLGQCRLEIACQRGLQPSYDHTAPHIPKTASLVLW